jgi:hypothetical protein
VSDAEGGNEEEEDVVGWPIKGPASPQQAMVAIALIFFLGIILGFLLGRTF